MRDTELGDGGGLLPELLGPGLDVVFVGAAPSYAAASTGHYYAGPRNRFWLLLHQAGLTPRRLAPEEDGLVLEYGIGLTAILLGCISTDNSLLPEPTADAREGLFARLRQCAPKVVAYNGRDVYRMCHGADAPRWGLQPDDLDGAAQFVVHSSSGRADRWGADRLFLYRELRSLMLALRTSGASEPNGDPT